jgi:hypothetical protein
VASPAPLDCKGLPTLSGEMTFPNACFMGYVLVNSWDTMQIPIVGGTAPYTVTLVSGYLPTGMALESDGTVEGYPPLQQDSIFTVDVTDSSSPAQTLTTRVAIQTWGGSPISQVEQADDSLLPATQSLGPELVQLHDQFNNGPLSPPTQQILNAVDCYVGAALWEITHTLPGLINTPPFPQPVCQLPL